MSTHGIKHIGNGQNQYPHYRFIIDHRNSHQKKKKEKENQNLNIHHYI